MSAQYKISIRKVLQALLTLMATAGCLLAMVSASRINESQKISGIQVHIDMKKKYRFVEESKVIREAFDDRGVDTSITPLKAISLGDMERALDADPWIENSQVYVDNNRVIHIAVTQRKPVARLFTQKGNSLYMDRNLHLMPLVRDFTYYTLVVTNVPELGDDSLGKSVKSKLLYLVNTIRTDSFWNAQISQIMLDSAYNFELVPMLGEHTIIFGDTSRMVEKFSNLLAFYKNVFNRIGWDRYQVLDVRYKGQVIASPMLPYNGPVERVDKSWLVKMLETEARKDSLYNALEPRRSGREFSGVQRSGITGKAEAKKEAVRNEGIVKKEDKAKVTEKGKHEAEKEKKDVEKADKKDVKPAAGKVGSDTSKHAKATDPAKKKEEKPGVHNADDKKTGVKPAGDKKERKAAPEKDKTAKEAELKGKKLNDEHNKKEVENEQITPHKQK